MVKAEKVKRVLHTLSVSIDDPHFFYKIFERICQEEEANYDDPLQKFLLGEFNSICFDLDQSVIQESWSWRNAFFGRELAKFLINDKGEIQLHQVKKSLLYLENHLFSLGPGRHHDVARIKHVVKTLKLLLKDRRLEQALKRIHKPFGQQNAEKIIRETLFLRDRETVLDAHARQAALSALLTYLRQNVGSCFATAPAILIQEEQPLQFIADMAELIGTGRLKRTYEGIEYATPLSASWGISDLKRPFLFGSLGSDPWKTLASAPGILSGLEAAGILDKEEGEVYQRKACEKLLKASFPENSGEDSFLILSSETIFKTVLLNFYGISEKDVEFFQSRQNSGFGSEVLIVIPQKDERKSLACSRYIKSLASAKEAFKGVTDNALLKTWEFTLASLSETKADFARWNLYASLGLEPEEPYGLGECFGRLLQDKIEKINEEIASFQNRYDQAYAQVRALEGRITRASKQQDVDWIQAEYQTRKFEMHRILVERDELFEKGQRLNQLFNFILSFYMKKFSEYFQEVYDAEMHDISANPYDDSSAGFRLLYKHGRSNTSLWTLINTPADYIRALASFFIATEIELSHQPESEGLQSELTELVTAAISHIKTQEFLESSFFRLSRIYGEPMIKTPLENLEKISRKPWSYISGGTMGTLVSCYYGSSGKPEEKKQWVENETELLVFFLDTLRELPPTVQQLWKQDSEKSLLAFSPTHAFLCKPGFYPFRKGWEDNNAYTYSWVRDHWMIPQKNFLHTQMLDTRMMDCVVDELQKTIPQGYRSHFKNMFLHFPYSMKPSEFREFLLTHLSYERWVKQHHFLSHLAEEVDSALFRLLPLFPEYELKERLELLFSHIQDIEESLNRKIFLQLNYFLENIGRYKIFTAQDLRNIAKALLILALGKTRSPIPFHHKITESMQINGLCYPAPILFADTNWVKNYFGFLINPGTENLEFWRFDHCGSEGRPIASWKQYLNGTNRLEWGVYTSPFQYTSPLH